MKNKNIIIVLVILIGMATNSYAQETVETDQQQTSKYTAKRSPLLAAGLSAFTLGLGGGQYYNKQYVKGGIMTAIGGGMIIWMLTVDGGGGFDDLGRAILASLIFIGNWAYSIIDAPISAAAINKKYGLPDNKISLSPSFERNKWNAGTVNVGLKLTYSLN